MSRRPRDLTSDPAAERLATPEPRESELVGTDVRSGGEAARAPHSLQDAALQPDDEALASAETWDDVERL